MKEGRMRKTVTIVGFGASITAAAEMSDEKDRWLGILAEKLRDTFTDVDFKVINAGIGGKSARENMARFESDVLSKNPDYIILDLCGNNLDPSKPERQVHLEEFKSLLERYKRSLPATVGTVIFTLPPMFEDLNPHAKKPEFKEFYRSVGGFANAGEPYRAAFMAFGVENGYPVYDLRAELREIYKTEPREKYIYKDGIHLSAEGNKVLAGGIFKIFKQLLEKEQSL
jgi:lysophospholipase L1-like esterase